MSTTTNTSETMFPGAVVHPQRVLVSGASGLVGSRLVAALRSAGAQVFTLVRRAPNPAALEIPWDIDREELEPASIDALDAAVHLSGSNVAAGAWTVARKREIRDSRVRSTRLLCRTLARVERAPRVLINASAVGYYGDRADEWLDEECPPGDGFLADVCREWEAATEPAADAGIRVVRARLGVVLSPDGGALRKMRTPFSLGLGGVIGDGRQYMSWISLTDLVRVLQFLLAHTSAAGPINVASPNPVTNREFTDTLGRVLERPTILPLPAFAARLMFGEMADETLLASARVRPARLAALGCTFRHPELESALRAELGLS